MGHVVQQLGLTELVQPPPYGHTGDPGAVFAHVVIQQADHRPATMLNARNQQFGSGPSTQHQGSLARHIAPTSTLASVVIEHADHHPRQGHGDQGKNRVQSQNSSWHFDQLRHQDDHGTGQPCPQAHPGQTNDFVETGVTPTGAWHANRPRHHAVNRDDTHQHGAVIAWTLIQPALHPHAEQVCGVPGQGNQARIGQQHNPLPLGAQVIQVTVKGVPHLCSNRVGGQTKESGRIILWS